jgi:hypothetical protein
MVVEGVRWPAKRGGKFANGDRPHLGENIDNLLPRRRCKRSELLFVLNDERKAGLLHGEIIVDY